MPTMKDKDLLDLLLKNGWMITGVKGSHHRLKKRKPSRSNPRTRKRYENRPTDRHFKPTGLKR